MKPAIPPDTVLAHVRVLRLTDRLLGVADELREAREKLQVALDQPTLPIAAPHHRRKVAGR